MTSTLSRAPLTDAELDHWERAFAEYCAAFPPDDTGFTDFLARVIPDIRVYRTALRAIAGIQASSPELRVWRIATKALAGGADFPPVGRAGRREDYGDEVVG